MARRVDDNKAANTDFTALRDRLEHEKQRLTQELDQMKGGGAGVVGFSEVRHEGSPFGKREEEATEVLEYEKRLALEKRVREQLVEVEAALQKHEHGSYGRCEACGNQISPDRLEAFPQARLCMTCKAKQGKDGKVR